MAINPRSIAVDGVGFGHRALCVLGFKWFAIEIIPPIEITTGGGQTYTSQPKLIISVKINGRWIKNEFIITNFYDNIKFIITNLRKLKFNINFIGSTITNIITKATLNKVKSSQPKFNVEKKDVEIKVRRNK